MDEIDCSTWSREIDFLPGVDLYLWARIVTALLAVAALATAGALAL